MDFAPLASLAAGQHGCFAHRQLPRHRARPPTSSGASASRGSCVPAEHRGVHRDGVSHPVTLAPAASWPRRCRCRVRMALAPAPPPRCGARGLPLGPDRGRRRARRVAPARVSRSTSRRTSSPATATSCSASRARRWSARSSTCPRSRGRADAAGPSTWPVGTTAAVRARAAPGTSRSPVAGATAPSLFGRCSNGAASATSSATPGSRQKALDLIGRGVLPDPVPQFTGCAMASSSPTSTSPGPIRWSAMECDSLAYHFGEVAPSGRPHAAAPPHAVGLGHLRVHVPGRHQATDTVSRRNCGASSAADPHVEMRAVASESARNRANFGFGGAGSRAG